MRIKNIASGSSGNVTYIGSDQTHILIDTGVSKKRILEGLNDAGLTLADVDAILITHEHIDHISSLGVIERAKEIPVYATKGTIEGIKSCKNLGNYNQQVFNEIKADTAFEIGDLLIDPIATFHDSGEPVCYKVTNNGKSSAVVTDLGEYDQYLVERLKGLDAILLEANHDVRMLEVGPYPYPLKQRILGKYGHLSNEASGQLLSTLLHDEMKYILLGHLSKENNTRELAKISVEMEIKFADNNYMPGDFNINVAHRETYSETVEV